MIIPCALALKQCLPCNDDPIRNITAEAPDVDVFIGFRTFKWNPPLGVTYFQLSCTSFCFSTVSQLDADLCALRSAQECVYDGGEDPPPPRPPGPNDTGGRGGGRGLPPQNPRFPIRRFRNTVQSCEAQCPDGSPFIETVPAGVIVELSQALADAKAKSLACKMAQRNLFCISGTPPAACVGDDYFFIVTTNSDDDLIWSIEGELPPGLTFDFFDATITGTPTASGSYTFIVDVVDSRGRTQTKVLTICVMEIITPSTLPEASIGFVYAEPLIQQPAIVSSENWTLVSGSLPPGILLSASGSLTGIPTEAGMSVFTLKVDAMCDGLPVSCQKTFSLEVAGTCGVDWGTINWDTFFFDTFAIGGATASGTGSAAGDTIQFNLQSTQSPTNSGLAAVHAHGSVISDVNACSFKLRINLIQQDTGAVGEGDVVFGISIYQDGVQRFIKQHGNGAFPFTPTLVIGMNEFDVPLIEATASLIEIRAAIFPPGPLVDRMAQLGGVVNGPPVVFEMSITMSDT